jgi:uncharacterized LabA/DUF88 family protein
VRYRPAAAGRNRARSGADAAGSARPRWRGRGRHSRSGRDQSNAARWAANAGAALFIDGANLYATAKRLGFDIDYKRCSASSSRARLSAARLLLHGAGEDQEYSSIRPLIDWLDYNGYTVVTKPTKEFVDAMGRRKVKGNMDIELAVDAMEMAERVDHIVLFSGDGDFRSLVEALQRKGRGHGRLDALDPAADDRRRAAPPGRQFHRPRACSRYNTNTGRLTTAMFNDVFAAVRRRLDA